MLRSGRRYAWPVVIDVLKLCLNSEPRHMVRGPRSKHIGPWSTDLEPRILDSVSRFKLRGYRLVDGGPGLLGMVAGSGANWVEGWGLD